MSHFFAAANRRLFGSRFAEDGRYRPRNGADIDLLRANGQGLVAVTAADEIDAFDRQGQVVPRLVYQVPAAPFEAAGCTPREGDTIMFGTISRIVKSAQRIDDGLNWRLELGETW